MVVTALGMVLLMAGAGLAVDMGYLRYVQRRMQNAADSAAVAATAELLYGDYVTAGQNDAASNGFTNGSNNVTVAVNYPPTLGLYANQTNFVEVIITQSVPTFFMTVAGYSTESVSARAVGHYWSGTNCIFALDPTASGAITVTGSVSASAECGIMDDSNSSSAFVKTGSGSVNVTSNMIVGGLSNSGSSGSMSPTPTTGVPPESDPLGYLAEPTVGSCDYTQTYKITSSGSYTLSPGVYCGGISISGSGTTTFSSGTYIIEGAGLSIAGSSTVLGSKVLFYITGGAGVSVNGSNGSSLSAATTGTYAGVLFFQDRTDSASANISGGADTNIVGALYFPDANLDYTGSNSATTYTILVADTITLTGTTYINDKYSSLTNGSPVKTATLAE
jgi:Flp pilus assembly protein TadG